MRLRISLMALMAVVTAGTASPALAVIPNGDFSDPQNSLNGWTVIGNVEAPSGHVIYFRLPDLADCPIGLLKSSEERTIGYPDPWSMLMSVVLVGF